MCGIAGLVGIDQARAEPALRRMLHALRHRGPDAKGLEFFSLDGDHEPVGLAHARLAIVDLSPGGIQPMEDAENDLAISFNGEIYNYRELREELGRLGHAFRTASDTEVILRAHREWGDAAVERLRGMFAYGLLDRRSRKVLLVRDRIGIKPLYVAKLAQGFAFASEVRALLTLEEVRPVADGAALESYFAQGMVCGMQSIVRDIRMLEPGTTLTLDANGNEVDRRRYWELGSTSSFHGDRSSAVARLGRTMRSAVSGHLISDVPLGLFLSSGIDSGALTTMATEIAGSDVRSIAIGFDQPEFDESSGAEAVARELGAQHTTIRLSGADMLSDIDEVFDAMDQPTVDGFNTFFVSRAARRAGLTVALSGVGGDELFGGYASFTDAPRAARLSRILRRSRRVRDALAATSKLVSGRRGVKLRETLRRAPDLTGAYLLRRELLLDDERRELFARPDDVASSGVPLEVLTDLERIAAGRDSRNAVSLLELRSYMRDMLLRDGDVFSMAVGLELRVPILDHEVVDLATSFPGRWKKSDGRLKPLLVDAAGNRLPRATNRTKKRGFTFPWGPWLRGPLRSRVEGALGEKEIWRSLGVRQTAPTRFFERFLSGDARVGGLEILSLWVLVEYARRRGFRA